MVAFRSKQRRAMPIPAGANQSHHSGENGKLGLEARLPAIQRKALHKQTWAAAMRNQGNRIKETLRQTAEHGAGGMGCSHSKWQQRQQAAGAQQRHIGPTLQQGGKRKEPCWGGERSFMGWEGICFHAVMPW